MEKSNKVIGIDFGTSNSYLCNYYILADKQKIKVYDFGDDQKGSIPSTILYKQDTILIGSEAEEEWGESLSAERKNYELRTHFKPDIAINQESFKNAIDFLKIIRNNLQRKRVNFFPDQQTVIMGIPALANDKYRSILKKITKDAGYENVSFLPEPTGALIYHLWNKDLSARQTQGGILVIDFGGGTCDFTYLQQLNVRHTWGDMLLGGRLFDDLFFQWFLDQNPNILQHLSNENDEYIVHWFLCRKFKEKFSSYMLNDRNQSVTRKLGRYGSISDLTWNDFINRAKEYTPHPTFVKYLKETNQKQNILTSETKIDLLAWFKKELISGLKKYNIRSSDIQKVILTGGSSQWAFVEEIVCEVLHLDENKLLSSANPKAAISEGLVVYPHLKQKMNKIKNILSEDLDNFVEKEIIPEINSKMDITVDKILQEISNEIFDDKIKNRLLDFRNNGGTINSLKENIQSDIYPFLPKMKKISQDNMLILQNALPESVLNKTHNWFLKNEIKYTGDKIVLSIPPVTDPKINQNDFSSLESTIADAVNVFVGSILGIIFASIQGLLLGGPIGWIIELIGIAVATFYVLKLGRKQAKGKITSMKFGSKISKIIISKRWINKSVNKGKEKFKKKLKEELTNNLEEPKNDMIKALKNNIQREIDSLSVINQL